MSLHLDKLPVLGRIFFGLAVVAFGIQQIIYNDFVPGRAPAWPPTLPGRLVWLGLSTGGFIWGGLTIAYGKKARCAAILTGTMIFVFAFLRHVPEVIANPHGIVLTSTGKALFLFGGAFAVAGSLPTEEGRLARVLPAFSNSQAGFIYLGRFCVAVFLVLAGIQHFQFAQFVVHLVPGWIPGAMFWTYFAGVALIAGGAGLLLPPTMRLAATLSGLMIFLWVLLLHIPRALYAAPAQSRNEWTAVFEALAISGILFVLTKSLSSDAQDQEQKPAP